MKLKTQVFNVMADTLTELSKPQPEILVITRLKTVFSKHEIGMQHLQSCLKAEEAVERIFMHVMDQSRWGFRRLMIVTVETDEMQWLSYYRHVSEVYQKNWNLI